MTTPATRAQTIARAEAYVDDGRFEADLAMRVAIRTESQKFPDNGALVECYRYLETEMIGNNLRMCSARASQKSPA
jgi:hypothetical protein